MTPERNLDEHERHWRKSRACMLTNKTSRFYGFQVGLCEEGKFDPPISADSLLTIRTSKKIIDYQEDDEEVPKPELVHNERAPQRPATTRRLARRPVQSRIIADRHCHEARGCGETLRQKCTWAYIIQCIKIVIEPLIKVLPKGPRCKVETSTRRFAACRTAYSSCLTRTTKRSALQMLQCTRTSFSNRASTMRVPRRPAGGEGGC